MYGLSSRDYVTRMHKNSAFVGLVFISAFLITGKQMLMSCSYSQHGLTVKSEKRNDLSSLIAGIVKRPEYDGNFARARPMYGAR